MDSVERDDRDDIVWSDAQAVIRGLEEEVAVLRGEAGPPQVRQALYYHGGEPALRGGQTMLTWRVPVRLQERRAIAEMIGTWETHEDAIDGVSRLMTHYVEETTRLKTYLQQQGNEIEVLRAEVMKLTQRLEAR